MSDDLNLSVKLALESQNFQQQITTINRQMNVISSGFTAASGKLGEFGNATDKLREKSASLSQQIELAKSKIEMYAGAVEKSKSKLEASITAQEQLSTKIAGTTKAYEASVIATGADSEKSKSLQTELVGLNKQYTDGNSIIANNSRALDNNSIKANNAQRASNNLESQLKTTDNQILVQSSHWTTLGEKLTTSGAKMKEYGDKASKVGKTLSTSVTLPVLAVGAAAAKVGLDFDSSMSKVQATSGATTQELKKMSDEAVQLGQKTAFSAKEAADGMENLASAGFTTNEIMQAMPGMLNLAASGGLAVADAADIASSSLRGFGLDASKSGHVADVFAQTAATTNATVTNVGEAMTYVAPTAHSLGMSIEETSAAIGEMSDAGIKGSTAGTTLRSSLVNLAKPTKEAQKVMDDLKFSAFDASGKMKPFGEVLGELKDKTKGLTQEQKASALATLFGKESLSGMMVLVDDGKTKYDKLTGSLDKSNGAADKMAKTMQNNAKSAIEQMMGSLETAGIKLETAIAPTITSLAKTVEGLANSFSNLSPATQGAIIKIALASAAIGPVLITFGKFASAIGSIKLLLGGASTAMGLAAGATEGVGIAGASAVTGLGATGLAGSLATAAIAAAPFVIAGVAVVGTGLLIKNVMDKQVVPAVDLFADKTIICAGKVGQANDGIATSYTTTVTKISDGTAKAVGSYMELDKKATTSLQDLYVNSTVITAKNSTVIIAQYVALATKIKTGLDTRYTTEYNTMRAFFDKSSILSKEDEAKALTKLKSDNESKKTTEDNYSKQITAIVKGASDKKRALTLDEQIKINAIQDKMRVTGVKTLSNSEVESKVILNRIADYGKNITTQQASDEIKNANKARDGQVKSAKDTYDKSVASIIRMRDESHSITADQAKKLIADAKKQKDESIKHAEEMRSGVVNKVTSMNKSVTDGVDTVTGNMKTKWTKFAEWWNNLVFKTKTMDVITATSKNPMPKAETTKKTGYLNTSAGTKPSTGYLTGYATGTNNAPSGMALVGELGPEILNLAKGDTITTAKDTAKLLNPKVLDKTKDYAKIGAQITAGLVDGIKKGSPDLLTNMTTMTKGIMDNFGQGIQDGNKPTVKITNDLSDGVTKVFTNLSTDSKPMGVNVIDSLSKGMISTTGTLKNTASNLSTQTKGVFTILAKDVNPLGGNVSLGLANGISDSGKNVTSVVKTLTDKVIEQFKVGFDIHSPSRETYAIGGHVGQGLINGIKSKDLKGFVNKQMGAMMGSFKGSLGNGQLTAEMMAGLEITGTPLTWLPELQKLIMFESGGNPGAINLTDSNAMAGHPSQGLMQEIPATYNKFKMSGFDKGITDPLSNIIAGIRYIKDRYTTIFNTPGIKSVARGGAYQGYATGTNNATAGLKWVGENGPELLNFKGGETVTNAKDSAKIASDKNNNQGGLTIKIEKFINNREQDIEALAVELAFYTKQQSKSIGGSK